MTEKDIKYINTRKYEKKMLQVNGCSYAIMVYIMMMKNTLLKIFPIYATVRRIKIIKQQYKNYALLMQN